MGIQVACSHCGASYYLRDAMQGKGVRCKACGETFRVPRSGVEGASPKYEQQLDSIQGTATQRPVTEVEKPDRKYIWISLAVVAVVMFFMILCLGGSFLVSYFGVESAVNNSDSEKGNQQEKHVARRTNKAPQPKTQRPPQVKSSSNGNDAKAALPQVVDSQPVDLLKLIDLERDTMRGKARMENGHLITEPGSGLNFSHIAFPVKPPRDYDLVAKVTRLEKQSDIGFGLVVEGRQCKATIDGRGGTGVDMIGGRRPADSKYPADTHVEKLISTGEPLHIVCSVRTNEISITVDGQRVFQWSGDPASLSLHTYYRTPKPGMMFVSTWSSYRVSRLELRPYQAGDSHQTTVEGTITAKKGETPAAKGSAETQPENESFSARLKDLGSADSDRAQDAAKWLADQPFVTDRQAIAARALDQLLVSRSNIDRSEALKAAMVWADLKNVPAILKAIQAGNRRRGMQVLSKLHSESAAEFVKTLKALVKHEDQDLSESAEKVLPHFLWSVQPDPLPSSLTGSYMTGNSPTVPFMGRIVFPTTLSPYVGMSPPGGDKDAKNHVHVFDLRTMRYVGTPIKDLSHMKYLKLVLSPRGRYLLGRDGNVVNVWSAANGQLLRSFTIAGRISLTDFAGPHQIITYQQSVFQIWDVRSGEMAVKIPYLSDGFDFRWGAFTPGRNYLILEETSNQGYYMLFYDLRSGRFVNRIEIQDKDDPWGQPNGIAVTPDGERVSLLWRYDKSAVARYRDVEGEPTVWYRVWEWEVRTGKKLKDHQPIHLAAARLEGGFGSLQYLPEKQGWLVFGKFLIEYQTGNILGEFKCKRVLDRDHFANITKVGNFSRQITISAFPPRPDR